MSAPRRPARAGRPSGATFAAALLVALAGCDGSAEGEGPAVDPALVDALVEVHLADARAALSDSTGRGGTGRGGDSLRAVALAAHGLDADGLDRALDRLARDPALAEATYAAVTERLRAERYETPAPPDSAAP